MTKKNKMLLILGILTLIITISGVTYAFFQYVKTGAVNTIKAGKIRFSFTEGNTIDLENLFPITRKEAINDESNNSTCEIVINGYSTYEKGVEYRVSAIDTHLSINRDDKTVEVPVSVIVNVEASGEGANDNLGTEDDNYFSNRTSYTTSHYKKLAKSTITEGQMILVGFIANNESNTDNSVNGKITIKAFFDDDKMHISDTPNDLDDEDKDKVVLSTSEWQSINEVGASFRIKVEAKEGIWVDTALYDIMQESVVLDNIQSSFVSSSSGIDFSKPSGDTDNDNVIDNGKGLYKMASTANDDYPIVYYRGDIDNNNVVFANKCWKMVRTTDTGGIKLLYNGEYSEKYSTTPLQNESDYNIISNTDNSFTWNSTNKAWEVTVENQTATELIFAFEEEDDYFLEVEGTSVGGSYGTLRIFNGMTLIKSYWGGFGNNLNMNYDFGSLTGNDFIKIYFNGYASSSESITLSVKMTRKGASLGKNCNNLATDTLINDNGYMEFSYATSDAHYDSPAYNGYMYGTVYNVVKEDPVANAVFGNSFVYENNEYKLTSSDVGAATNRHYTCNSTDSNAGCESIRYYFRVADNKSYYILISGGKSIETALAEMQENTVDSNAKTKIDNWYAQNIATNTSYTQKIEDTIWCNDRSSSDLGGFNPNSGGLKATLYYSAQDRLYTNYAPSLSCSQNDAFTVNDSRGNRKLTYPVALLTADELTLAGARYGNSGEFYIGNGAPIWTNTPNCFTQNIAYDFYLYQNGTLNAHYLSVTLGLRPSISLKSGVGYITGNGTVNNPYIVS